MKENKTKKPLSDFIFDELRSEILSGNLKPGERLMEIKYAQSLGVSRTPFREAVRKLEKEGLVTVLPRRGAHVSLLSVKDLCDVLDIRCALDMLAIEKFIENAKDADLMHLKSLIDTFARATEDDNLQEQAASDVDFHEYIYTHTGNERLVQIYYSLKDQLYRFRILYLKEVFEPSAVAEEHYKMLDAIHRKNIDGAKQMASLHIQNQKNNLLKETKKGI